VRDERVEGQRIRIGAGVPRRRIDIGDAGRGSREFFLDIAQGRVSFAPPS
jgi:hypothetical protein